VTPDVVNHHLAAVATVVAGLATAATAAGFIFSTPDRTLPDAFGTITATPVPSLVTTPSVSPPTSNKVAGPSRTHTPAPVARPSGLPVRVAIPRLNISAAVIPTGTAQRGIAVPDNPDTTGWWVASAPAGSATGATVIVGHVDSAATGPGALYRIGLGLIHKGDTINVSVGTGVVTYHVDAQQVYVKINGIPASAFAATGPARLVLITCGGPFDRTTETYRDNIVVYAVPG
jgi:hypothetical protein